MGDIGGRESRGEGEKGAREGGARRGGVGGRGLPGLRSLVLKGHGGSARPAFTQASGIQGNPRLAGVNPLLSWAMREPARRRVPVLRDGVTCE